MKTEFVHKAAIICIDTHGGVSFFFPLSNQRSLCSRLCACSFASGSCVSYAGTSGVGHCDLIAQRVSDHVVKNIFYTWCRRLYFIKLNIYIVFC